MTVDQQDILIVVKQADSAGGYWCRKEYFARERATTG
jgi:hypothetical protein